MVKRNLIHSLMVLSLLLAVLTSCSKKNEYTNVIPADARAVVSVNLKSMIEKSGLGEKDNQAFLLSSLDSLKSIVSPSSFQQIEKLMKNPQESGLSVSDRIYLFSMPDYLGLVLKISDESKLKETFKLLQEQKIIPAVEVSDGSSWISLDERTLIAFDKNVLLVLNSSDATGIGSLKTTAKTLLAQKEENSIRKSAAFRKIDDRNEDITAFVSFAAIPNMEMAQSMLALPAGSSLKDLMALASLNFEKGRIVAKVEMFTENKELRKILDNQTCTGKTSGEFFDFFPASTLMFLNYSLNGEKLYETLAANPELAAALNNQETGIDLKKLITSFGGDISIGVTGFSGFGMPNIAAYAKMNGNYLMELIAAQKQMFEMTLGVQLKSTGKNAYLLNYQGVNIFIGMTGNYLYVSNDPGTVSRLNEKVSDPMTQADWASDANKTPAFFAVNVAEIMKNPLLNAFASSGNPNMAMGMSVFSECSYIKVFQVSKNVAEMDIVLKNQNENVLKLMIGATKASVAN